MRLRLHEGASAAETTIDGSAFGVLRSPIALPVGLVCGGAMVAIGHLAEELDALSRNLRTMAANYEAADPQAQRTYRATRRDYSDNARSAVSANALVAGPDDPRPKQPRFSKPDGHLRHLTRRSPNHYSRIRVRPPQRLGPGSKMSTQTTQASLMIHIP